MRITQSIRDLILSLFFPATCFALVWLQPEQVLPWQGTLEIALPAMAFIGALVATGFAQWRSACALVLSFTILVSLYFSNLPVSISLICLLALACLPWMGEGGLTGNAPLLTIATLIIAAALWLRGGPPAAMFDRFLTFSLDWRGWSFPVVACLASFSCLLVVLRLLWKHYTNDMIMAGLLLSALPLFWFPWVLTSRPAVTQLDLFASGMSSVLVVWFGLILHAWRMAYIDALTGVPNRRALEDHLKTLSGKWSVAMLDVDHFKKFNDTYGHDVGDQVLRRVAVCLSSVGDRGKAFRYGGEEFAILFPYEDEERSTKAVEIVRNKVSSEPFQVRQPGPRKGSKQRGKNSQKEKGQKITVSAGLAQANGTPPGKAFKRADQALYKAKKKGRDCLVAAK